MTWLEYDEALVDEISAAMDLRTPNAIALGAVAENIESGDGGEFICDLATGVGKTYLAASLIDYLARKGVRNVLFVTPGTTIHTKTIANFTPGSPKFVEGAEFEPLLITADNFARGQVGDALHDDNQLKLFVFNVQQLISPTVNTSRKTRADDEFIGGALYDHLRKTDDLVIIADEHHVYSAKAKAFNAAINELSPRALVGLTATPDPADRHKVIYRYSLAEAIADQLVKIPVIVYRQDGLKDAATQLADAAHLRQLKEPSWRAYAEAHGRESVAPVLFVVCQTIKDAESTAETLTKHLPEEGQVLLVTSQSTDVALTALANVESPDSPVRAIVSVDKLKEGWDVRNIGVIVGLRALASETLTEQILGRGLRLPFGARTGHAAIDQVDVVAHESYRELLKNKDSLLEKMAVATPGATGVEGTEFEIVEHDDGVLRVGPTRPPESLAPGADDVLGGMSEADILIVSTIDAAESAFEAERASVGQFMPPVAGKPHIVFPRRDRTLQPVQFTLESLDLADVKAEGKKYGSNQTVNIQGTAIDAERDLQGEVAVSTHAVESVEATQNYVPADVVRRDLVNRILGLGLVPAMLTEKLHAEEIADAFLEGAGVSAGDEANWTSRRAAQAESAIATLVRSAYARNDRRPAFAWAPQTLLQPKPAPPLVKQWYDDFVTRDWYGGWSKSAESAASFDSYSGEFAFAKLVDDSEGVAWWLRLYQSDPVYITMHPVGRYYPDFIVIDDAGVQWLIEAKSDAAAANDATVAAKKSAAEEWAIAATESRSYGTWRYLLVTETDIKNATNWEALVLALAAHAR